MDIQTEQDVDLTGSSQHGFKKKMSTTSLSLTMQTLIANALEEKHSMITILSHETINHSNNEKFQLHINQASFCWSTFLFLNRITCTFKKKSLKSKI